MLNTAYAYLAEQAEAADAVSLPAYRVAGMEDKDILAGSRRTALDDWLKAPYGADAEHEAAVLRYLTS